MGDVWRRVRRGMAAGASVVLMAPMAAGAPLQAAESPPEVADVAGLCANLPDAHAPFPDVAGNPHETAIRCASWLGLTSGVTPDDFVPADHVSRGQLASFLARFLDLVQELELVPLAELPPAPEGDLFGDLDGSEHRDSINRLAAAGILEGFGDGTFGPQLPVRRDQVASFLHRMQEHLLGEQLDPSSDFFVDDQSSVHHGAINVVTAEGVTQGRADGRFHPRDHLRRDQMASFLIRKQAWLWEHGYIERPDDGTEPPGPGPVGPWPTEPGIRGTVWFDADRDGTRSGDDEVGVPGITVRLATGVTLSATTTAGAAPMTATTDATGAYRFADLAPGPYVVTVVPPAERAFTTPGDDSLANPFGGTIAATAPATAVDAGLVAADLDYGDAPDSYGTTVAVDGARHVETGPYLGRDRDTELDGQPTADASGDDCNGLVDEAAQAKVRCRGDEDGLLGISLPGERDRYRGRPGETATLLVEASGPSRLDAWIDVGRDGVFDGSDQVADAVTVSDTGAASVAFTVPADATPGPVTIRLRLSSRGGLGPTGFAGDGEVEDHPWEIEGLDFGDAPSPYPTLLAADAARHWATAYFGLGPNVPDAEVDGIPSDGALGDDEHQLWPGPMPVDDEDGVDLPQLVPGRTAAVVVRTTLTGPGTPYLNGWIDLNRDGDWSDAGEHVLDDVVTGSAGEQTFDVAVPATASPGPTYARFRISHQAGLSSTGFGGDGEVEDHAATIGQLPATGISGRVWFDADGDGTRTGPDDVGVAGVTVRASGATVATATTDATGAYEMAGLGAGGHVVTVVPPAERAFTLQDGDSVVDPFDGRVTVTVAAGAITTGIDAGLVAAALDYGDAPDTFGTTIAVDGARHVATGPFLGWARDSEPDGKPGESVQRDDCDWDAGEDETEDGCGFDEDGLLGFEMPDGRGTGRPGDDGSVVVWADGPGFLDAWVDFGQDGTFATTDQVVASAPLTGAGAPEVAAISVPDDATPGPVTVRLRFSSRGGLGPTGFAGDGEVEDHQWSIEGMDLGDAPAPYPTLRADDGARHWTGLGPHLGASFPDPELDGNPSADARGDDLHELWFPDEQLSDDEDGVYVPLLVPGSTASVVVDPRSGSTWYLNGWIDFNGNGSWSDPGEHVLTDVTGGDTGGFLNEQVFPVAVPADATAGTTFARFRISDVPGLTCTGLGGAGEVEDHRATIGELTTIGGLFWRDVDGDGLREDGDTAVTAPVEITLLDAAGERLVTVETGADGRYELPVPPGTYQLLFRKLPAVFMVTSYTYADVGDDDSVDSDVDPLTYLTPQVVLAAGDSIDLDAGARLGARLNGRVFIDANANGTYDAGEQVTLRFPVYLDNDGDGAFSEGDSLGSAGPPNGYHGFIIPWSLTSGTIDATYLNDWPVPPGTYTLRIPPTVFTDAAGHDYVHVIVGDPPTVVIEDKPYGQAIRLDVPVERQLLGAG